MPTALPTTILSLGDDGNGVTVTASPHPVPGQAERLFDVRIEAAAHPFSGAVEQTFLEDDLSLLRQHLRALTVPGEVVFGGDRAARLRLVVEKQEPGPGLVVEAELTPSGDDPLPLLRWLIFNQDAFVQRGVEAIDALLGA
ncbi:MAG: hypothetical protein Q8K63_09485 [Acidimicrobiales bacterium]|nr:hypothetical protein [Acidimicrobiales bacterium]